MAKDPQSYNVRAVERAAFILSSFDSEHPQQGVSEVAKATGLHKATAHRIIMTLLNCGFLDRTPDGERFQLGTRMVELGLSALRRLDFRRVAYPYMQDLVKRFNETCDLGILNNGQVLCLEVVHSAHSLTIAVRIGRRLPLHCTASGHAILAFSPPEVMDSLLSTPLQAYTDKTITSLDQLLEELEATRMRGYGLDVEGLEIGIRAVSVPIRDMDGYVIGALSMPGPRNRLTSERVPEIAKALLEASEAISARIVHGSFEGQL